MTIHRIPMALVAVLALAGAAQAQQSTAPAGRGDPGTMSSDTNGSTTMPADIVPGSVGASGTSSRDGTPYYTPELRMPTRDEVKAEAASMTRAGTIARGELSTAFQDRGAQLGSTPY